MLRCPFEVFLSGIPRSVLVLLGPNAKIGELVQYQLHIEGASPFNSLFTEQAVSQSINSVTVNRPSRDINGNYVRSMGQFGTTHAARFCAPSFFHLALTSDNFFCQNTPFSMWCFSALPFFLRVSIGALTGQTHLFSQISQSYLWAL